ncbi:tetratricopeptide repeat protein [Kitasatospora sp. NPDC051705]|uniref:tetratricopeptide repeat protein n=1 Tax=Kitasatospora sp. NPDC051705 TaxID=3364057 RepID=UPI00378D95E7
MTGIDDRVQQAERLYEQAVFGGDTGALTRADRCLDAVEADLALARGRVVHARFVARQEESEEELALFERAERLYAGLGDDRGRGEALFWIAAYHQVVRGDHDTAQPLLRRSLDRARGAGDTLTASYALRHLGILDHMAGRLPEARAHLEESTRLRREADFAPGVAANLVGLAYIAGQEQRRADAAELLREATALAEDTDAYGVLGWITGARTDLGLERGSDGV